jgi:hypothetical protein
MYRFAIIAVALSTLPALAENEPDDEALGVFNSVKSAWSSGNAEGVGASFDKDSEVALSLDSSGSYSKDKAINVLKKYFDGVSPLSLKPAKDAYKGGSSPSATFEYEYKDANGKKHAARLFVSLARRKDRWVVAQIAVLPN